MTMKERWQKTMVWLKSMDPRIRLLLGIVFILLGLLALVTPLTPGSWLVFVGLELIGIRLLAWRSVAKWFGMKGEDEDKKAEDDV